MKNEEYVELCGGVKPIAAPEIGSTDDFDEGEMLVSCGGLPCCEPVKECDMADPKAAKDRETAEPKVVKDRETADTKAVKEGESGITELVFILDRSGSMSGMEADTVGGFNSMIAEQKKGRGRVLVTTVLFSSRMETLHDRLPIEEVSPITEREYRVGGSTALYDAIGETVKHISMIRRYIRPADIPSRTLSVITTDGEENASRTYTSAEVKRMVSERESAGWEFLFLAANIDAFAAAEGIGIKRKNAAAYSVSEETGVMYSVVSDAISHYRARGCVEDGWASDLGGDAKPSRRKK